MATTIDRTGITFTNDTGTPASPNGDGTLLSAADRTALLDAIDDILSGNVLIGGTLGAEARGTHNFSGSGTGFNTLRVYNSTAGTANGAEVSVGNDENAQAGRLMHTSSTYTPSAPFTNSCFHVFGTRTNGLRIGTTNASEVGIYANSTERVTIGPSADVSINASLECLGPITQPSVDAGTSQGRMIEIGRNSNGTTPAAGTLLLRASNGTAYYLWVDTTGDLRVHTSPPSSAGGVSDTAGTVVGTQT